MKSNEKIGIGCIVAVVLIILGVSIHELTSDNEEVQGVAKTNTYSTEDSNETEKTEEISDLDKRIAKEKARLEAEYKAEKEAEEEKKAKLEAEEKARLEAEEKARLEAQKETEQLDEEDALKLIAEFLSEASLKSTSIPTELEIFRYEDSSYEDYNIDSIFLTGLEIEDIDFLSNKVHGFIPDENMSGGYVFAEYGNYSAYIALGHNSIMQGWVEVIISTPYEMDRYIEDQYDKYNEY